MNFLGWSWGSTDPSEDAEIAGYIEEMEDAGLIDDGYAEDVADRSPYNGADLERGSGPHHLGLEGAPTVAEVMAVLDGEVVVQGDTLTEHPDYPEADTYVLGRTLMDDGDARGIAAAHFNDGDLVHYTQHGGRDEGDGTTSDHFLEYVSRAQLLVHVNPDSVRVIDIGMHDIEIAGETEPA